MKLAETTMSGNIGNPWSPPELLIPGMVKKTVGDAKGAAKSTILILENLSITNRRLVSPLGAAIPTADEIPFCTRFSFSHGGAKPCD